MTHAGGRRRGSGYRVTVDAVLTAAHVLEDAVSVQVRFESDLPPEADLSAMTAALPDRCRLVLRPVPPGASVPTLPGIRTTVCPARRPTTG